MVWERSLKKKYAYDDRNCQVFIRLLVELIGSPGARAEFPAFLDKWVKGAGNTRDGSFFAVAAGATTFAALGVGSLVLDPTGVTAAGFMLAAQTTLRSSTWLLTERHLKGEAIKDGQKEIRAEMKRRGRPLADLQYRACAAAANQRRLMVFPVAEIGPVTLVLLLVIYWADLKKHIRPIRSADKNTSTAQANPVSM